MFVIAGLDPEHPWFIYVALPFIMAAIGYGTKIVAIEMMFRPLEFRGPVNPWLGWQGQVPRHAAKMAAIAVDTLTKDLLKAEELFDRIDPDELAKEIEAPLRASIEEITHEVMSEHQPGLWEALPERAKQLLMNRIGDRSPDVIRNIMVSIRANVDQVFDMKHMVVSNLVRDKELLCRMFRDIGAPEFEFIKTAGLWFGFVIGLAQSVAFLVTNNHWVLPAFGLFTGATTDWLAIQMIFRPKEEVSFFGIKWQGLFHKRREEVTKDYGELIAKDVLTPRYIVESLLTGPMSDKLFELIQDEVKRTVDSQTGITKPFVVLAVGGRKYQDMKRSVAEKVVERIPTTAYSAEEYASEKLDLANTLVDRMQQIDTDAYENLLRPAFKDDEKIVIAVGAFLGFVVGELQTVLITAVF
jgi:uncharacterized membrane protein YheB (UPF0754 family)